MTDPYVCHIWFAIYHQYTPVMLAYRLYIRILWEGTCWWNAVWSNGGTVVSLIRTNEKRGFHQQLTVVMNPYSASTSMMWRRGEDMNTIANVMYFDTKANVDLAYFAGEKYRFHLWNGWFSGKRDRRGQMGKFSWRIVGFSSCKFHRCFGPWKS